MLFERKDQYGIDDLLEIMRLLRSDEGCPWDREQTHKSIRSNLIEETYEAVEAIDTDNAVLLEEELGDVLLQVVFHAQMEEEQGRFSFANVVDGICKKLIVRHPHVFGSVTADTSEQVLQNWDAIKMRTKQQRSQTEVLLSVSKSLPALMRAVKVCGKAAKSGVGAKGTGQALSLVREKLDELESTEDFGEEELGRLLLAVCDVARVKKLDAEQALSAATDGFIEDFSQQEK